MIIIHLNYSVMKKICASIFKICLVSVLFTFFTDVLVHGQDIIVQKNGEEIKSRVEQVLDTEIKYRKADNLNGPLYTIKKTEVFMIKYENGSKDVFGDQPVISLTEKAPVKKISFTDKDLQPARNATILGGALVIPILGLGITSGVIDDNPGLTIPMGAVATLIGAIGIPVVSHMAGKTRNSTGVEGNPGLRLAGWIGYGLALSDAVVILGLAAGGANTSGGPTYSVAALGAVASIIMAVEASQVSGQAKHLRTSSGIQPTFGTIRDFRGNQFPAMGFRINF
jgi:hypothetical protein